MKCKHVYYDGAGHYCRLMPMPNEDYPHEHWRVFCHGNEESLYCKNAKCAHDKQTNSKGE